MANKGVKKKKSNYTNADRIKNRIRKLSKHIKNNPSDEVAKKALTNTK